TAFDPPEADRSSSSAAGDIWALGVTLFEALTRRSPSGLRERAGPIELPEDFSAEFRDVVGRCLSPSPHLRPTVGELLAWTREQAADSAAAAAHAAAATAQPVEVLSEEPKREPAQAPAPAPAPTSTSMAGSQPVSEAAPPAPTAPSANKLRSLLAVTVGAALIAALCWNGLRIIKAHGSSALPPPHVQAPAASPPPAVDASAPQERAD